MTSHRIELRSATAPGTRAIERPHRARARRDRPMTARSSTDAVDGRDGPARRRASPSCSRSPCGVIALVVRAWFAASARRWLAFPFAGIPATPGRGGEHLHPQPARARGRRRPAADRPIRVLDGAAPRSPGAVHRTLRRLGEALLGAAVAANVIVVGASFGAYGTRMLRAALPHGPVELAAYSLALALYLQGRNAPAPDPTRARGRGAQRLRCSRSPPCSRPT